MNNSIYTQLKDHTVLSLTIQFRISHFLLTVYISNTSIRPIDKTLSGATTTGLCGPGTNGNEGVLPIPLSSSITEASPSNCFVSYTGHPLAALLPLYKDAIDVFYSPSRLGSKK